MKYRETTCLRKIHALKKRIQIVQGGTSAGKTVDILLDKVLNYAILHPGEVITTVTDSFPNLRTGAMRDFLDICRETNIDKIATWNKTNSTLYLPNNSLVEFYSVDTMGAHGARRDVLYVNEANRISWETFSQLEVRTRKKVILDFNPVNEFWAHKELISNPERTDVDFLKVTYKDNEALDKATKQAIEMRRGDGTSNWWRVYGLGEIGSLEGNVYQGWKPMAEEEIIKRGKLIRYGLDFGFSQDQTALVGIYDLSEIQSGAIGLVEMLYQTGIIGSQYPEILQTLGVDPTTLIVADGARPEIIAEIQQAGYMCIAALKDKGSVKRGIDYVQERPIYYAGKNLEQEFFTYQWRRKKSTGETLDAPQDGNDHLMDAIRYAIDDLHRPRLFAS